MKKIPLIICFISFLNCAAQDHFSGINTSNRVSILNVGINPAELSNLTSKYEANLFSISINASNNKIGFIDIVNGNNIENKILKGNDPINMRLDSEIYGPGFGIKMNKWAFGFSTKAYAKLNMVDFDPNLGNAINRSLNNLSLGSTIIKNNYNQRLNGTSWGEIGFSMARNLFENEKHKFNAGATLKLLFPGSYTNFGLDQFQGTINVIGYEAYLNNTNAKLNIAYSENLNGNFKDYTKSMFGQMNGVAADFGLNYQLKDKDGYKIKTGISIKNIGGLTFNNSGNSSTNYSLKIQSTPAHPNGLAMSQFQNNTDIIGIEAILQNNGYLTKTESNTIIKVKLPTTFTFYADLKVNSKFFLTLYTQQKLGNDAADNQITTQNIVSVIPRFTLKNFEIYSPWSSNEISGTTGGFGLRIYGLYFGSSSIVTALVNDTKQADLYLGYTFGLK